MHRNVCCVRAVNTQRSCLLHPFDLYVLIIIAATAHLHHTQERLKSVLNEIKESHSGILLFIDEIHLVVGAGKAEGACHVLSV